MSGLYKNEKFGFKTWSRNGLILLRLRRDWRRRKAVNLSFLMTPVSSPGEQYWPISCEIRGFWHISHRILWKLEQKCYKKHHSDHNLSENARISKDAHEIGQYCSPGDETGTIRKLRFTAFQRRQSRLKRSSISPFRGHVLNPNFSFL